MITIITAVHGDRKEKLERAVNSVLNQTYKDWELIITSDGSSKRVVSYIKECIKNPQIKAHFRKTNWGNQTKPINEVIPMASGRYIAFLDSDNEYLPDHLQVLYNAIINSDADLVYGDRFFIDDTGQIQTQIGIYHDFAPQLLLQRNYIDMSDFLVKKECLLYVGGMDEKYVRFADWNFLVRMVKAGFKFLRVPTVITNYHYHAESLSNKVENKDKPNQPLWNSYELEVRLPYLGKIPEPKVAVFTLTKDRLFYTKTCFNELKNTSGYNFDHFVVDNGSVDGTIEWLEEEYKPYKLIINSENMGISIASNQAIESILEGEYDIIIKVDNDALSLTQGWLKEFVELYKRNHMMVWSPYPEGLRDNPGGSPRVTYGNLNKHLIGLANHLGGLFHVAPSNAYDTWRWDEADPKHGLQDLLFSQHLAKCGFGMAYVEDIRVEHFESTDGQQKRFPEYFEKRKEEKEVDLNTAERWNKVYEKDIDDKQHNRNDDFSFEILKNELTDKKILDVGCGNGFFLSYLKGFKDLYGIDFSEKGIQIAKTKNKAVKFAVGSSYALPYDDSSFDYVVTSEVLEHLKEIKTAITQIHRVLKEGGYSVNLLPFKHTIPSPEHVAEYDEESIKELFKDFKEVETRVYTHPSTSYFDNNGSKVGNCQLLFVKAKK